ncbi:MAG: CehA/McbA family metallohydrolase [bacterium]|nr:CehA/McbA family metallohydrolase [bacterium]
MIKRWRWGGGGVRGARWSALVVLLGFSPLVQAHDHRPPWLEESTLDAGLYVAVQHVRVIRGIGPVDIRVAVRNLAGADAVNITAVRYSSGKGEIVAARQVDQTLPTLKTPYEAYVATREEMYEPAQRGNAAEIRRAADRSRELLGKLAAGVWADRYRLPAEQVPDEVGKSLRMIVELDIEENGVARVIRRAIEVPIHPPLPRGVEPRQCWTYDCQSRRLRRDVPAMESSGRSGAVWYAGDQHVHTTYSLDALVIDGTEEDVTDYAAAAELMGLDWMIVTDHSNVHTSWSGTDYYTPDQFAAGTAQAAAYTAQNALLVLYGEEMGAGQSGLLSLPSHYLAYPFSADSTGYLANPSSGLLFGLANCESEQVIIDRVNSAGGFGFIAHPFDSGSLAFSEWDFGNGATGWSGLEIWSDTQGQIKGTDNEALAEWYNLLNQIAAPQQGSLGVRPGFPNRFPVGLGNSDAHQPGLLGATFTYAWMPGVSRAEVTGALMAGQGVASNGPLLFGEINGAGIGEVAFLLDGDNELDVTLESTAEFGPVGDYELTVLVNGVVRATIPPSSSPEYAVLVRLDELNLSPPDTYVTLRTDSTGGAYHAITNPVWLQFTEGGDADADGVLSLSDLRTFTECLSGPEVERTAQCDIMDLDRDRDVDLIDFAHFQSAYPDM